MATVYARDEEFRRLHYAGVAALNAPNASPLMIKFGVYWLLCAEQVKPEFLQMARLFYYVGWEQKSWDALLIAAQCGELEP